MLILNLVEFEFKFVDPAFHAKEFGEGAEKAKAPSITMDSKFTSPIGALKFEKGSAKGADFEGGVATWFVALFLKERPYLRFD